MLVRTIAPVCFIFFYNFFHFRELPVARERKQTQCVLAVRISPQLGFQFIYSMQLGGGVRPICLLAFRASRRKTAAPRRAKVHTASHPKYLELYELFSAEFVGI